MKRALGYVRVSTTEQALHGLGLPVQEQTVLDFCRRQGWELLCSYEDAAVSGTRTLHERPGLAAALAAVKERENDPFPISALVVSRWDRLGRDALVSLLVEQEFARHGCQVVSADGIGVDQTTRELFMVLAGAERRNLVARLAAGRRAKVARGGYGGGRPRIGWRAEDRELVVDEEAAEAVRGIFIAIAKYRWSLRRVARELHERRILGAAWSAKKVNNIVRDSRYKLGQRPICDPRIWNAANRVLDERRPLQMFPHAASDIHNAEEAVA